MTTEYVAGSVVRSTATFVPTTGTVELADVVCHSIDASGNVTSHTPVAGATNVFYADINTPNDSISGPWDVLWETGDPDITFQDRFQVVARTVPAV